MGEPEDPEASRAFGSRILSAADGWSSRPVTGLTLAMLFVVQHTQARLQHATQRKLDELLRALPDASNALVHLEHGSDDELRAAGETHRQVRQSALDEGPRLRPGGAV